MIPTDPRILAIMALVGMLTFYGPPTLHAVEKGAKKVGTTITHVLKKVVGKGGESHP